jgi:nicotinamide mononucleotide transporter
MSPVEVTAVAFGLACVILTIRQSIWSWPTGLVQVVLYIWIFKQARLYSDMVLHVIYVPMQLYGWYHWLAGARAQHAPKLPIRRITPRAAAIWLLISAAAIAADGYLMRRYFDAALPYWDAAIAVLSLLAQYLLARKVLENWILWITIDVIAIGVYWAKDIKLTAGLYAVFLVLAITGLIAWIRDYRNSITPESELKATTRIPNANPATPS